MAFYKYFLNRIVLPVGGLLTGAEYTNFLRRWEVYDTMSARELNAHQNKGLEHILKYAIKKVPHYQQIAYNESLDVTENLRSFPVLTKQVLRQETNNLLSQDSDKNKLIKNYSSGSSGVQSFTYTSKKHLYYLRALQTHWWKWSGYSPGDKVVQFGISKKRTLLKRLKDLFFRTYYYKAFGLKREELLHINKTIKEKGIAFVAGYPSVMNQLCLEDIDKNKVNGVISFGDKLFTHHEKNFKAVWGKNLRIVDTYGCAEGLLMACKKDLDYYYIMSPHVYIEIVNDDLEPVKDGEMGHILVTCLTNKAMPIIRYKLGDLGIMLPETEYPKNARYQYPLLQKIVGRETDVIKTANGTILNVHSFTGVFEYFQEIEQFKIIQNDLEHITIEYIAKSELASNTLNDLKQQLLALTKSELSISFIPVKQIKATASGKPQIIETTLVPD